MIPHDRDFSTHVRDMLRGMEVGGLEAASEFIRTRYVLHRLLSHWPGQRTKKDQLDLHALCRLIHLGLPIRSRYGPGWTECPEGTELAGQDRRLLTMTLLAWASPHVSGEPVSGLCLKCLNAASSWIDRLQDDHPDADLAVDRSWADQILDSLVHGNTP